MAKEDVFKWLVVLVSLTVAYLLLFSGSITPLPNMVDTILGAAIGIMGLFIGYKLIK